MAYTGLSTKLSLHTPVQVSLSAGHLNTQDLSRLLITTFLAFCALYAPQPILPTLSNEFAISPADASLLITATLLPLGLAPIFYGYLIAAVPARTLLRTALLFLALGQFIFAVTDSYSGLMFARILQGFSYPAAFTAIMTYCSTIATKDSVRRVMGLYISATICGGFAGRLFSGAIASSFGWRYTFYILAAALIIMWFNLAKLQDETKMDFARLNTKAIVSVLSNPIFRDAYLLIFLVFFVFASLLNALPFRLIELYPELSEFQISLVYAGYLVGALIAVQTRRISTYIGGDMRTVLTGLVIFLFAIGGFSINNLPIIYGMMFTLVTGMFLIHSILSGHLNHLAQQDKGVVNGLYISFYYAGGSIGSWLPTILYNRFDWSLYILLMLFIGSMALFFALRLQKS